MKFTRKGNAYTTNGDLPKVGDLAPDFTLTSTTDETVTRDTFKGHVTLISVVPDINTRVCDLQTKAFHHKMAQRPNIELVTISKNTKEEFLNWCSANDVEMTMLSDTDFTFGKTYGLYAEALNTDYRSVFVLDRDGKITYVGVQEEMTDEPDYDTAIQAAEALLQEDTRMTERHLYPEITPYKEHALPVSNGHTLYVAESGNPEGHPVVILHGGPGGSSNPQSRQFFDPEFYHIIQFDQRGCGKSTPAFTLEANTTQHLVSDMEVIREFLGIDRWLVFGGSWGTTLALHYAIQHTDRVIGLLLRGIFLGRQEDITWLYQKGAGDFFPDNWQGFLAPIPESERDDLLSAYYKRLSSEDATISLPAARAWAKWEGGIVTLVPDLDWPEEDDAEMMALARLECHYFYHHCFVDEDNYILNHAEKLRHLPIHIVHGRYDVDCRPSGAWDLHVALPQSELVFAQAAGHAQSEPSTMQALLRFAEDAKAYFEA